MSSQGRKLVDPDICKEGLLFRQEKEAMQIIWCVSVWYAYACKGCRDTTWKAPALSCYFPNAFRGKHVTLTQRDRSRCGAVHILRTRSEPSAHFGWVKSLSLWRSVHFANAKRTFCALWVGQIALAWRGAHSQHALWEGQIALAAARCAF